MYRNNETGARLRSGAWPRFGFFGRLFLRIEKITMPYYIPVIVSATNTAAE